MTLVPIRPMLKHVELCMGTAFSFHVAGDAELTQLRPALERLHEIDRTFSTYQPQSQISRLGRGELDLAGCDSDVRWVLERCAAFQLETDGYFSSHASGELDPSGLVKGWAVEQASKLLREAGLSNHMINGGGDIQCHGEPMPGKPWRIGIQDPEDRNQVLAVAEGNELAVATSGTAERGHHILDPHTGRPVAELRSVSIIGSSVMVADVYATAAFAMGSNARAWLADLSGWQAFVVPVSGPAWSTLPSG